MNSTTDRTTPARPPLSPWQRLSILFRPDRSDLWSVVVFSIVTGILLLATPIAVQTIVNFVTFGATLFSLFVLALLLLLALLTSAAVVAIQNWVVEILQRRLFVRLVANLAGRLPRVRWSVRDRDHTPELVNRFFDTVTIQKVGAQLLLEGLANLLSILVGASVLAFYHPFLFAFDVVLVILIALVFILPLRRGYRTAVEESNEKYRIAAWLEEIAAHPLSFKCAGSRNYVTRRSAEVAQSYVAARRDHFGVVFGQILASLGLQVLASVALLSLGGWLVVQGQLTVGQLVAAELLVVLVVSAVAKLGKLAEKLYDLLAATDKVGKLLDLPTDEVDGAEDFGLTCPGRGEPARLELENVRIPGDGLHLRPAPIDLAVVPGSITAITGAHGVGKSALLEMLYRLRSPASGIIRFDGSNAADISLGHYREAVAFAAQAEMITASILENVTLGRPGISLHDVETALDQVGLLRELQGLPEGLGTMIRPSGAPLSSSQRSRLMLARSLAGHPRLLLVDELLDDLTPERIAFIRDALQGGRDERTVIMATDRPEVMAFCDDVFDLSADADRRTDRRGESQ